MGVLEEEEERGGGQQASCLVAKQAVEFPQVLASLHNTLAHSTVTQTMLVFMNNS